MSNNVAGSWLEREKGLSLVSVGKHTYHIGCYVIEQLIAYIQRNQACEKIVRSDIGKILVMNTRGFGNVIGMTLERLNSWNIQLLTVEIGGEPSLRLVVEWM